MIGTLIRKETLHLLRDARTLLVVLFMPVVLLLLFGFAISTEVNEVRVTVVDEIHNDESRLIIGRLQANPYVTFAGMASAKEMEGALRRGEVDAVVVLSGENGILKSQICVDASNTTVAQASTAYLSSIIGATEAPVPVISETLYNPQMKSAYNFVPGIMGMIFILICAIMTSVSIVSEKERGTMDMLLVSPARPGSIIIGKLVPYFMLSMIMLTLMLALGYTVLDIPFSASVIYVYGISLLYIALALSIGLLVSTIARTQVVALIVSAMLFMIPVVMLSGMIFPIENMPAVLQGVSAVVPARWYIDAMRKLMIQQLPLQYIVGDITILLVMTIVILAFAVRNFKRQN